MNSDEHPCDCERCGGDGTDEVERDCSCRGCYGGEHEIELPCGVTAMAPCDACDIHGKQMVEVECERCGGDGLDHRLEETGEQQRKFDGTMASIERCTVCETEVLV